MLNTTEGRCFNIPFSTALLAVAARQCTFRWAVTKAREENARHHHPVLVPFAIAPPPLSHDDDDDASMLANRL